MEDQSMGKQVTVSEHIVYIKCLDDDIISNINHSIIANNNNYYSIIFEYNSFSSIYTSSTTHSTTTWLLST